MPIKLAVAAAAVAFLFLGLRWFEKANLYIPSRGYEATPKDAGIPYEEVVFESGDGTRLAGWLSAADGPLTLVVFHGNAGNISHRLDKLRLFRGLGLSVLLFDYRGYGRSEGSPTESGTYLDGLAAVDFLSRRGVPPERVAYYGESLGCAVALETALRRPPAALILDSGFTSTVDMGKAIFPFLPVKLMVRYKYDNIAKIPRLKAPLLVLHSPEDDIVPFSMGRRLFEAAPEPKRFFETRGDHNEGFLQTPGYAESMKKFLAEHVR